MYIFSIKLLFIIWLDHCLNRLTMIYLICHFDNSSPSLSEAVSLLNIKHNSAKPLHTALKRMLLNISFPFSQKRPAEAATHSRTPSTSLSRFHRGTSYAYLGHGTSQISIRLHPEISEKLTPLPECQQSHLVDCISDLVPAPELLLIDIDALSDTTEAVEILTRLRLSQPQIVLIILSGKFLVDDIDQHRISICDAALRLPLTSKRFETALNFACDTNKIWQKRVSHSQVAASPTPSNQQTLFLQS